MCKIKEEKQVAARFNCHHSMKARLFIGEGKIAELIHLSMFDDFLIFLTVETRKFIPIILLNFK